MGVGSGACADWYIATNGSASNSGTSPADPFLDLETALDHASPGDVVHVGGGIYSGAANVGLTLDSITVIGATNSTKPEFSITESNGVGFVATGVSALEHILISSSSEDSNYMDSRGVTVADNFSAAHCDFEYLFYGIYATSAANLDLANCTFTATTRYGVDMSFGWDNINVTECQFACDTYVP